MKKNDNSTKRFIAGVTCPNCNLLDKTIVYSTGGQQFTECVRCGFKRHAKNLKEKPAKKIIWLKNNKEGE